MKKPFVILLFLVNSLITLIAQDNTIPVETFFENDEFKDFKISPDGEHLIAIAPYQGVDNLFILELETMKLQVLTNSNKDIGFVHWVNDERVIYALSDEKDDARSSAGGLVGINIDGTKQRVLIQPYNAQNPDGVTLKPESIGVISLYSPDSDYVLIQSNKRRMKYPDVYLLNVYSGSRKTVFFNPGRIQHFVATPNGQVCFGIQTEDEGFRQSVFVRNQDGEWNEKSEFEVDGILESFEVLSVDDNGNAFVAHNIGRDKKAVFRYDLNADRIDPEPVLTDNIYDVEPFEVYEAGKSGRLIGLAYDRDYPTNFFLHDGFASIQEQLDAMIEDCFNHPVSASQDATRIVVRSYSDVLPPFYSLLDLKKGTLVPLSRVEKFKNTPLCETRAVSWDARDGRRIHGYLTLPKSWSEGNPVPMIVRPHGGPWARETWGLTWHFPMERQFYANRGFAVLEVNFRGSTGYGKDHLSNGFKNVESMHTDFVDGTLWAIQEGYADSDRIGIGGASWGGYAAMYGVTKFPQIYKFAVNFMGVVDLPMHINRYLNWDRDLAFDWWTITIGDPRKESDLMRLNELSPIHYIENIQGPVFVYHGLKDINVDIEQSRKLESALKKHGIHHEVVYRIDEAHSTHFEDDRINSYQKLDVFLRDLF